MSNALKQSRLTIFSILILLAGAGWVWISRADPGSTTSGSIPAPQVGFLAPDFSLVNQNGEIVQLSDLRGQPILLNFWASWCGPCRSEMPSMQKVYQELNDGGIEILAVNSTIQDDPDAANQFARELGLTFPILFDTTGEATRQYLVRALPTSFFIDRYGIIQEIVVGGPISEALLRIRLTRRLDQPPIPQEAP